MSNQRLPNEEVTQRVSVEEKLDYDSVQGLREGVRSTNILYASEKEENAEYVAASSNEANEEISSSSTDQETEEAVADESKQADQEQIMEPDAAAQQQQQVPTMSPEQVLLLQVLRRAKRQQDLIIEVQKNLKSLTNIQKDIERTKEQVKQLHSAVRDSQRQIIQVQRQIVAVERAQEKGFEKLQIQKRGAIISVKGKVAKNRRKGKKLK
jgi:hypothetical protein